MPVPLPAIGAIGCDPDLRIALPNLYELRNKHKARNYIQAEITSQSHLKYYVQNLPKDGRGCPGRWLFEMAWEHFFRGGIAIRGIRGEWSFGDNLDLINRLTAGGQVSVEAASMQTWAFDRASSKGFTLPVVMATNGSPGNFLTVDVLFLP